MYVDVHTHLTHEKFNQDLGDVLNKGKRAGLGAIIVNGLEPVSNRQILKMAAKSSVVYPALGIYPSQAVAATFPSDKLNLKPFDVDEEIQFIESCAAKQQLVAIGECGIDGYWHDKESFEDQERVLIRLAEIGQKYDLPIIVHSRKLEKRCFDVLDELGQKKVNFHCYSGKSKYALSFAEKHGWSFSIPANLSRSESFQKLVRCLPVECLLTETDAPYLAPQPGERNEPMNVVQTVHKMAEIRSLTSESMKQTIWKNFHDLFDKVKAFKN